jgi:hypothetical protein
MNLLTGLFRAARKRVMTTDNDMGMFRQKLDELVASKDSLSDEEVVKKVEELKGYTSDLPGEGKAKIDRFLEDFKSIKEQDEASAKEAAGMVADLFEKLDTEAMQDVPAVEEAPAAEETPAETAEPASEEETVTTGEIAEETEIPAEGEEKTEDADPNPEYTLEEIYQFCKKRREEDEAAAADASACDSAEEVEEAEEEEEKDEEEVVTDHAPFIPVTINQKPAATGTLASMFAEAKKGR